MNTTLINNLVIFAVSSLIFISISGKAEAQVPVVINPQTGQYLGNLSTNQFDPNNINNEYGYYGNPYNTDSINNPYNQLNIDMNNPYTQGTPKIDTYDNFNYYDY